MPNDVIKLGRVRFKIRDIVSPAYKRKNALVLTRLKHKTNQDLISSSKLHLDNSAVDISPENFDPMPAIATLDPPPIKNEPMLIRQPS